MQISLEQVRCVLRAYQEQKLQSQGRVQAAAGVRKSDQLSLSPASQLYQAALEAVNRAPDVREELVQRLQQAIDSGTYHVEGTKVAEKMIERATVDRLV
ncbi:MAG: flagellar biosynthesis anti-sigma factor FlgM [Firmicutes bacterium]|nr:flagellar biosynthesis anti-sigma factor FlgM [Bacillota bacterium]